MIATFVPANIRMGVKLIDFTVAREDGKYIATDTPGEKIGTPGYLTPNGYSPGPPTKRRDLFAIGMMLNEMIHGQKIDVKGQDAVASREITMQFIQEAEAMGTGGNPASRIITPLLSGDRRISSGGDLVRLIDDVFPAVKEWPPRING